ncbi:MAG: pyridoxamine 5'-phosphate oxidase family protein, partial [Candidatus Limnocylindrales bacterium]
RRFLEAPGRYAVIATLGADGSPHQAVIWYAVDGDGILINSRVGRRWPTDLLRDPRVSLNVDDSEATNGREAFVTVQAHATVVATGDAAMADILALGRRYGQMTNTWQGQERVSFRLAPLAVTVYGDVP